MKHLKRILFSISTVALFASCSSSYVALYTVGLHSVESPADAKQQFGETKVVDFQDGTLNKYRYEDDYINIVWYVSGTQFDFVLTNKTDYSIKINWDDISYVSISGQAGRVMHSGIKYSERNNSQAPTTIPKGSSLTDCLIPTNNVYFENTGLSSSTGWKKAYLIPCIYKKKDDMAREAPTYVGREMTISMPIMIENVQNDYTFIFSVDRLNN